MKYLYLILVFLSVLYLGACKESSTDPGNNNDNENYFPNSDGNYYKYNVEYTDSNGTKTTSTRSASYHGTQVIAGTSYQVELDTVTVAGQKLTGVSYFIKNEGEVSYFLDTTGFAESIPAEYQQYLQYFTMDTQIKLLKMPFSSGSSWDVFKVNLNAGLTLTVIEVKGYYEGKENVTLNLSSGTVTREAAKIRYVFKLSLPNPENPLQTSTKEFTAYLWLVQNVGVAKMQGNATVLGAFAGEGIDFADTSAVVSQTLIQYNVK